MRAKLSTRVINQLSPRGRPYEVVDAELKGFLLRVQPSGAMTYYLSYRNGAGKRLRYRIGNHRSLTPIQARDEALQLSARVAIGEDIQEEKKQARLAAQLAKYRTLEGFLDNRFESWACNHLKTGAATIKRIRNNFSFMLNVPLEEISLWSIEKWRSEQLKAGKAPTTINRDVTALRSCLSRAVEWGVIEEHPFRKLKPIRTDKLKRSRYLSESEEKALRVALREREALIRRKRHSANKWRRERRIARLPDLSETKYIDHLQPMVLLSLNTGLRLGEVLALKWSDIDFDRKTLTVRGGNAKSGLTRHVPMNEEAVSTLRRWQPDQSAMVAWTFPSRRGGSLTSTRTSWRRILKRAHIEDFRWHDLRHHFASRLAMAGVDLNTVRELLGHSDLSMTLRYAHLSPGHKADAVAKLCGKSRQPGWQPDMAKVAK